MSVKLERLQYLAAAVLVQLHQQSGAAIMPNSILELFKFQPDLSSEPENLTSLSEIHGVLNILEKTDDVYGYHDPHTEPRYQITDAGSMNVAEELNNRDSLVHRYKKFGKSWLAEVLEGISSSGSSSVKGDEWLLEEDRPTVSDALAHKPRFTEFRDALITALYEKSNEEGLNLFPLKDLADEKGMVYKDGWIFEVVTFLDDHGYALARKALGGDETAAAKLNASGLEYAEELIDESAHEPSSAEFSPIPASDRYVEIDNNSAEFRDAKTNVESATEAIRGFNEPTSYDREQVVHELTIGQQLLKIGKVRVAAVAAMILAPLYIVYQDVAAEALRPVVEAAINAVKIWLGP